MPTCKRFLSPSKSLLRPLLLLIVGISIFSLLLAGYYLHLVGSLPLPPVLAELLASPPQAEDQLQSPHAVFLPRPDSRSSLHGLWPGIRQPPTRSAHEAGLADDVVVIGVFIGGKARAYSIAALSKGPASHVVNDVLAGRPVSVAYCNATRCARVFTAASPVAPLDLSVGGWEGDKGLILQIGGVRYALKDGENLTSPEGAPLPYPEMVYQQTTWKEWHQAHPDTDVYVASPLSSLQGG